MVDVQQQWTTWPSSEEASGDWYEKQLFSISSHTNKMLLTDCQEEQVWAGEPIEVPETHCPSRSNVFQFAMGRDSIFMP